VIAAVLIAVTVAVGGARWWAEQSTRSDRLEIQAIETVGPFAISGEDLPADWPTGLVAPAYRLRLDVTGDPQRTVQVQPTGETVAYTASGTKSAAIPAGEHVGVDVVVTPADCGGLEGADLTSPLIDAEGAGVPLSSTASQTLSSALDSLCESAGVGPVISFASARVDVFLRDRILVMRLRVATIADRIVLQPRDSTGFQGGGDVEATMDEGAAVARHAADAVAAAMLTKSEGNVSPSPAESSECVQANAIGSADRRPLHFDTWQAAANPQVVAELRALIAEAQRGVYSPSRGAADTERFCSQVIENGGFVGPFLP
jgi:hypothetical protein